MKTFQKPLCEKEEQEYFFRFRNGDLEAREILILRNLRLVAHVAKKYYHPGRETEEILAVGTYGLIKAVQTFDSTKGNRFATYAARCIENEIRMMLRGERKRSREVSMFEAVNLDMDGNEMCLCDLLVDEKADVLEKISFKDNLQNALRGIETVLDAREKQVILLRYGFYHRREMTQKEVAKILGISRSYVSRIEKKALEKLRQNYYNNSQ